MMLEKDDLGLSLGLNYPVSVEKDRLYISSLSVSSSARLNLLRGNTNWMDAFNSSSSDRDKSYLKGIDVNRNPVTAAEAEEEGGVSSPNSTVSSTSGKRSDRDLDLAIKDLNVERASSRGISDEEDGENSRKKLPLSKDQSAVLEEF